jgi:RHS repeat-associated protein
MGYGQADGLRQKFTSKERDVESGLDYFQARYYSSRFTSPDRPLIGQDEEDPQTWNLYLYTSNNSLNRVDPDGERWFYRQDDKGRVTELQWVNPNEDGTYTSPGEGWIEFVPTKGRPFLELYTENGTKVTYLGENSDGSPSISRTIWRGTVEDASLDIVGLFIPGRLGLKGLIAGASALWGKHLARRAAKEAFDQALAGAKHAGFLKNYAARSKRELERAIKSIKKQIAEHEDKIANPRKHIKDSEKLDPRQRDALINRKWPSDIQRQKEQLGILKELRKRK